MVRCGARQSGGIVVCGESLAIELHDVVAAGDGCRDHAGWSPVPFVLAGVVRVGGHDDRRLFFGGARGTAPL